MIKSIKIFVLIVLFFFSITASNAETLEQLSQELNDVKNELKSLNSSNKDEVIKIDKAVQNLDAIVDFANESAEKGDIKSAVEALELSEANLSEVIKSLPEKFDVTTVESIKSMNEFDMKEISEINAATKINKINKDVTFRENVASLETKGLDAVAITKNMVELGVGPLNAQKMIDDIKKAGSTSDYIKSPEYQAYKSAITELNQQMTKEMNKNLDALFKNSPFKSTAELKQMAANEAKETTKDITTEISSTAGEAASEAASAASEAANEVSSQVAETFSQTQAETMLADIKEMGSVAYTQSQAYADLTAKMKAENEKKMQEINEKYGLK